MTQASVSPQEITTRDLLDLPPSVSVEVAAAAFGIGRTNAYALARQGEFPCKVIRVGRLFRVVTADLRRVLNVHDDTDERAAA